MNILNFGNDKLPSIVNDPFNKQSVTSIDVEFSSMCLMIIQKI